MYIIYIYIYNYIYVPLKEFNSLFLYINVHMYYICILGFDIQNLT